MPFLSRLVILDFRLCEDKPKGLFHKVNAVLSVLYGAIKLACSAALVEYFLYKLPLKNKSGVFTLKVLLNEIAHVAAVK